RSSMETDLEGHSYEFSNLVGPEPPTRRDMSLHLPMPWKMIVGVSYRPTTNWNFAFDYDYTYWGVLNTLYMNRSAPILGGGLPAALPLTFKWESSSYYEFGATRYLNDGWYVSGGYIFNENSIPDVNYQPLVADMDKHFLSVGVGKKGKKFDVDFSY